MSHDDGEGPVGSLSEETVRLVGALQEWARESGGEYADAAAAAAQGIGASLGSVNDHIATGGADCRYCPLCQLIGAVRHTSPEVRHHLTSAATSLLQAAAAVMATPVPDRAQSRTGGSVDKIDLSDGDADRDGDSAEDWEDQ